MRRYFADYEAWMLAKPEGGTGFREALRHEVEKLAGALREETAFEAWRWSGEGGTCNTSSVTT